MNLGTLSPLHSFNGIFYPRFKKNDIINPIESQPLLDSTLYDTMRTLGVRWNKLRRVCISSSIYR